MFKVHLTLLSAASFIVLAGFAGCSGENAPADDVIGDPDASWDAAGEIGEDASPGDATNAAPMDLAKAPGIFLAGDWIDTWDTTHLIGSSTWMQKSPYGDSLFHVESWDNESRFAVARNDEANEFSPGLFSRFDWTVKNDTVYFCNSKYDATTAQEASEATPADPTDPASGGCGGFGWSVLTKIAHVAIRGLYTDGTGTEHEISDGGLTVRVGGAQAIYFVEEFDNESGIILARNAATNAASPDMWSRFDWVRKYGVLYVCHSVSGAATIDEARDALAPDNDDPADDGCVDDLPWTVLTPTGLAMDVVVDAPGDTGEGNSDASKAINGVRGSGRNAGGSDVFSLGYDYDSNGYIVLGLDGYDITDGPGTDFVVFENVFSYGEGGGFFMDPTVVLLSRDGLTWVPYPFDYKADDESAYSLKPSDWNGFAGATPTYLNVDSNAVDPFNQGLAGGDHFDIANLPDDDPDAAAIKTHGFKYLKLVPAAIVLNPDTGAAFVRDQMSTGSDIDGVFCRYVTAN